jgi:LDH2 family malate/lactate/ureidoglycolate dehydrogenase
LLSAGGATEEESRTTAEGLIGANLRGYESHGVMRIPFYLDMMKTEELVSGAELKILSESASRVVADANWGFGALQAGRMLAMLSERAKQEGIGIGTLLHCGHIGRLGEYCERAAAAGLVATWSWGRTIPIRSTRAPRSILNCPNRSRYRWSCLMSTGPWCVALFPAHSRPESTTPPGTDAVRMGPPWHPVCTSID